MNESLNIILPDSYREERLYITDFIFSRILGLRYSYYFKDSTDYVIQNGINNIVIKDAFWSNYVGNSYLSEEALPKVQFSSNKFCVEKDIPVLYGDGCITESQSGLCCGIDVFAGIFFMLTRWEEYVVKRRDHLGRFPATAGCAYRFGFLHRPIVNEYIEMLWNMLLHIGYDGVRKNRKREVLLTHDVDIIKVPYSDYVSCLRLAASAFIRRRSLKDAFFHFFSLFRKGPYDAFKFIVKNSESLGIKSHFYFMAVSPQIDMYNGEDYLDSRIFKKILRLLKKRNQIIGFLPSYYSYCNPEIWSCEKRKIENALQSEITETRQHYLRFSIPETFSIMEKNNILIDSSMGYADVYGYRCGTGDSFRIFNFIESRLTPVTECPLIITDETLNYYYHYDEPDAKKIIMEQLDIAQKYKMTITFQFSNSIFYGDVWDGWKELYKRIIYSIARH